MPNYPYTFQLPPLNVQDIPNDGVAGEFLGINGSGVLDWLPVATGGGDMLKSENLSGLASYPTARTNLGLGTGDSPTFANLTLTSPSLSSSAPVTISQTWGTTGIYTAAKVNVTETATANALSKLLDLQVGGTSKFNVNKGGGIVSKANIITANGDAGAAGLSLEMVFVNYGLGIDANGNTAFLLNGTAKSRAGFGVVIASDQSLSFTNTTHVGISATPDTILLRDSASGNTLALRNGAAAQTFNVYGTWTTAITNFERLAIKYNTTDLAYQIAAEKGTTNGDYRPLELWTGGAKRAGLGINGTFAVGSVIPSAASAERFLVTSNANSAVNIAAFRNASNTPKFQFFLNASADAELYIGSSNVRISEVGNSYFNGGNVGIGATSPTSKLQVSAGDVEVDTIAKGVILKSPDGTRYRVTVANGGTLSVAAV